MKVFDPDKFAKLLADKGYSDEQFGSLLKEASNGALHTARQTVKMWRQGTTEPGFRYAMLIAQVLECDVEDLSKEL